ncbi:hypothetical protein [Sulfoacidibacillus thermotolerans]|uniref:Uncharacterized protein n=1 Tax=Sulfoacidibacillus thermotolerans TaxID=1765684 RepID=A0A2U3D3J1_SULT2|nr:hypothetical protein [Sulfoacidibacillus thermotolerans]PWI55843.1 hypothetical protein BM613_13240 [Sulfoacidibacillus thermotolerans]
MINTEENLRRNFTLPRSLYKDLQELAERMTAAGPGKVTVSDLIIWGAKKIVEENKKTLD